MMRTRRPNNLPALLVYLVRLCLKSRRLWLALLILGLGCALLVTLWKPPALKVATFNIENYPKSPAQAAGAMELIASLDVDAVGVQEIIHPAHFAEYADTYLGAKWQFVYAQQQDVLHHVGLLFDDEVFELLETHTHDETVIYRGARAALEVRLRTEGTFGERTVRIFVVHLKAGADGAPIRSKQLRRLRPILEEAVASGDEVVIMGDFNATGTADRYEMQALAEAAKLEWFSRKLRCTSYWSRADSCPATPLDHILGTGEPQSVRAKGACETVGCETKAACPAYTTMISDHCPVRAVF